MSETECRHLPEPAWNFERCPDCGALVRRGEPVNARLLSAAKYYRDRRSFTSPADRPHADAIADAERAESRPNIVESIEALRAAGGKAWDAIEDVGEYLGRE